MNLRPLPVFASLVLLCAPVHGQMRGKAPTRDAATHEDLAKKMQDAGDPLNKPKPVPTPDQARSRQPLDLLTRSQIVAFNGVATLVPKGAVLHVPANLQNRLEMEEGARLVTWADFFGVNRGWIQIHEVSREQAEGKVPFDEKVVEGFAKSPFLIVAAMKGGPISVLKPKLPAEASSVAVQPQPQPVR